MKKLKLIVILGAAAMLLPSCTDVLGGIYDEPDSTPEFGFVEECSASRAGLIYIDATDYTLWTYIDFRNRTATPLPVDEQAPAEWDFAVHRYDTKTNSAKVTATGITDINLAGGWKETAAGNAVADIWTTNRIVTDMSTMMDGYLSYAASYYNPELSGWLNVDTSTMPPVYTPSGIVYIILLEDGTRAAVKLSDFMDSAGVKGFMSIQYIYPL